MRSVINTLATTSAILMLAATSACGPAGQSAKPNPNGDDALMCAALIFAVNNVVENASDTAAVDTIKGKYMSASTHYATAYAQANGKSPEEALGAIKLKGYRLAGTVSSSDRMPTDQLVERAKTCVDVM